MSEAIRIGILGGTGAEGRGLALRLARAGAHVTVGSRDAARAEATAAALREASAGVSIDGLSNADTIAAHDVVMLALSFAGVGAFVKEHRDLFRPGMLVIDVTVPVAFEGGKPKFVAPAEGSAAELIRALLPAGVALGCAFKTLPARVLEHFDEPLDCDDFICGDSVETRERVAAIVGTVPGLRPVDAGPLESARTLERMTLLAILINKRYKRHGARFQVLGI